MCQVLNFSQPQSCIRTRVYHIIVKFLPVCSLNMNRAKKTCLAAFFLVGERFGLVAILLLGLIVILSQNPQKAYSEEGTQAAIIQKSINGLLYESRGNLAIATESTNVDINAFYSSQKTVVEYMEETISYSYETGEFIPTPTPTALPTPAVVDVNGDIWDRLAHCESRGNWSIDTGNGYYGGLQFSLGAWASVGGSGKASDAGKDEQIMRGKMLQEKRGWGVWGLCAKKLGLN